LRGLFFNNLKMKIAVYIIFLILVYTSLQGQKLSLEINSQSEENAQCNLNTFGDNRERTSSLILVEAYNNY